MQCSTLKFCLIFYVFNCPKRILVSFLPSSTPHRFELSISFKIETSNQLPTLPHSDLCKTGPHSPDPKSALPFDPKNTLKIKSNSFAYIPSLKLAFIQVISSLVDHFLLRLTRREPSPDMVGLATRLSVV